MPYYSSEKPRVYHICKNCIEGKRIDRQKLVVGKPKRARLCRLCTDLQRRSICTVGIPGPTQTQTEAQTPTR